MWASPNTCVFQTLAIATHKLTRAINRDASIIKWICLSQEEFSSAERNEPTPPEECAAVNTRTYMPTDNEEGYNKEGYNKEGSNKEGYNKEG